MTESERQQLLRLRTNAVEWQNAAMKHLRQLLRSGASTTAAGFGPQWGPGGDKGGMAGNQFRHGMEPSQADLARFIEQIGGNPALKRIEALTQGSAAERTGSNSTRSFKKQLDEATSKDKSLLDQFVDSIRTKEAEANAKNNERYERLVGDSGEYTNLRTQRQSLADNFGVAASQDIDERLKETLGAIQADQASRGLANSTNVAANSLRAARDTAREQQRVREARDFRKADMLAADTDRIAGVVERRSDVQPNMADYLPLLMEYGRSNEGRGYEQSYDELAAQRQQYQPQYQLPPTGVSPYQAMAYQQMANQQSPVNFAANYFGGGGGGYSSPDYGPEPFMEQQGPNPAMLARLQREAQAKNARIAKRRAAGPKLDERLVTPPRIPGYAPPLYA